MARYDTHATSMGNVFGKGKLCNCLVCITSSLVLVKSKMTLDKLVIVPSIFVASIKTSIFDSINGIAGGQTITQSAVKYNIRAYHTLF